VDSNLLISKLFHYGFDTSSLFLIADYFKNRQQITKINNSSSKPNVVLLGVPQGSILGPLFFLIYINDLIYFINAASAKLFADDTTLYHSGVDLSEIINYFSKIINDLLLWCKNNRLDINWTKTFLMVFTNKRIKIPDSICFKEIEIKCVNEFKLLGITIDSKLSFNTHVSNLGRIINSKLFSIKRLFYLSTSVKVQFFKTFILPYFDYCLTLSIYFNKSVIQRLCNKYYLCLYMLFKLDSHNYTDYNELNEYLLGKFNIPAFQHRIIHRLSIFSYKMLNFTSAPEILKENIVDNFLGSSIIQLSQKEPLFLPDNSKSLRNRVITISSNEKVSKYALKTFTYFSNVFLKCLNLDSFNLKFSSFITYVTSNIKSIFSAFLNRFSNFNFDINKIRLYKSDSVK